MHKLYQQALALIRSRDSIILQRHAMPDGDAVGAQTGLKELLRDNFPEKRLFAVGDSAARFDFLPDSQPEDVPDSLFPQSLCIILDCGGPALIADERWRTAGATLRFDHHLFQATIAQVDISDSSFESTCGMLTDFALSCGLALSPRSALPLYMGMVTDSGRFRHDTTTPRTLRLAAALLEQGIDTNSLYRNLYAGSLEQVKQRAYFTGKIQFTPGGVAYLKNSAEEIRQLEMDLFEVSRGMVGVMADLKGVDIWANFTEAPAGIYAELRSSDLTVQPIAVKYGGGGHAKACGATLKSWEEADAMLKDLDALKEQHHE
ncbi:MAG: bifunctional oligoribonuclease/PAP phosphatase NrnA [Lachnospiraceae bacterium]|nr:bifunctional oligoribonuclease/PAP phosphatase NrnA [Lachnospiraceae bacterium]